MCTNAVILLCTTGGQADGWEPPSSDDGSRDTSDSEMLDQDSDSEYGDAESSVDGG